jgi:hypothetical protein
MPDSMDERAHLYRGMLAGRRALVVLDDAAGEAQVRPLLPGTAGCAVVVTGRTALAGLEGARWLNLDVLAPAEAMELLTRVAGTARVTADDEAIVRSCGYLPLAVRIAGARLATQPRLTAAALRTRLAHPAGRLDELSAGDLAVRPVLARGYDGLDGTARRALALLGWAMPAAFPSWGADALLGLSHERTRATLAALVDANLLDSTVGDGGYRFHPLIQAYARERALADHPAAERREAIGRLADVIRSLAACRPAPTATVGGPGRQADLGARPRTEPDGSPPAQRPLIRHTVHLGVKGAAGETASIVLLSGHLERVWAGFAEISGTEASDAA